MTENTIDIQVLKTILTNLATEPDQIHIDRNVDELGVLISVRVSPKDMGIVIGRNGIMANSIKTIMKAVGKSNGMNIRVQIQEPDGTLRYTANSPKQRDDSSENQGLAEFPIN